MATGIPVERRYASVVGIATALSRIFAASLSMGCAVTAVAAASGACSGVQNTPLPPAVGDGSAADGANAVPETGTTADASGVDASIADGVSDALGEPSTDSLDGATDTESGPCAPLAADLPDATVSTTWSPFTQVTVDDAGDANWQSVDLTALGRNVTGDVGGAFDGRYVYYAPAAFGIILRYDTAQPFAGLAAWSTFDTQTLAPCTQAGCPAFTGAVFDGRFVYFLPEEGSGNDGLVVRYDTTGAFAAGPAWTTFDTRTIPVADGGQAAHGFYGGTFDGRYLYLAPVYDAVALTARLVRYDTLAAGGFGSTSAWETFDVGSKAPGVGGYVGAVFDGRYVYLVPFYRDRSPPQLNSGPSGIVARYDTTQPLAAGWLFFDIASAIHPEAAGFAGASFDGRYLYLVPSSFSKVARLDTTAPLDSTGSWTLFDLAQVMPGPDGGTPYFLGGGAFDGRFVYFMPAQDGLFVRYDTLSPFTSTCAWTVFDTFAAPGGGGSFGAVYDGQFLYLMPTDHAVRFDTKSPAWMPASVPRGGSFF